MKREKAGMKIEQSCKVLMSLPEAPIYDVTQLEMIGDILEGMVISLRKGDINTLSYLHSVALQARSRQI